MQMARQFHCGVSRKITLQQHVNNTLKRKSIKAFHQHSRRSKIRRKLKRQISQSVQTVRKCYKTFLLSLVPVPLKLQHQVWKLVTLLKTLVHLHLILQSQKLWTLPQLVAKAEIIATLQYASQNIPYSCADALEECYKQQFPDSAIAKHISLGSQQMSYMVAYGLVPYFQQATVKEIIQGNSYFTVHFDETVSA